MCIWERTLLTVTTSPSFFLICYTFKRVYGIYLVALTASSWGSNSPFLHVLVDLVFFPVVVNRLFAGAACVRWVLILLRRHSCFGCYQHLWVLFVSDFMLMFGLGVLAPHRLGTSEPFCRTWNWLGFIPRPCLFPLSLMVPGKWLHLLAAVLGWCMDFFTSSFWNKTKKIFFESPPICSFLY